ncbi:MAG: signal peptidase I [Elainellaceae cyanobacterium]
MTDPNSTHHQASSHDDEKQEVKVSSTNLQANKANEPEPENFFAEFAKILLLSIVLALGIRHFVAEARFIPSGSMLPTLEIDDRLIVEKMTYRFRDPERGDIVVFHPPDCAVKGQLSFDGNAAIALENADDPAAERERLIERAKRDAFIKRIVALPGETVEVHDGYVYIDGQKLVETYIEEAPNYRLKPTVVPEGSYLVFGDNRNNSYDGHMWGFLPREEFIGRASVRIWPLGRLGALNQEPLFSFDGQDASQVSPVNASDPEAAWREAFPLCEEVD